MSRARDPARDQAREMWEASGGKIKLRDIAAKLNVPESTVRAWKAKDCWDGKNELSAPIKIRSAPKAPHEPVNSLSEDAEDFNKTAYHKPVLLWEMQLGESVEAFDAFAKYRDMGIKRSILKVAQECTKNESLIKRWSSMHNWVLRVGAWDEEQDRLIRLELVNGITAMRKTHAYIASAMITKAAQALKRLPAEILTMQDISRAVDVAAKLERLSRGEATERTEGNTVVSGTVTVANNPYDELTTEELRRLVKLADESEA